MESLFVRLLDPNGNLKKALDNKSDITWEYRRRGGCGQCTVIVQQPFDSLDNIIEPKSSIQISIDGTVRYSGKILVANKTLKKNKEAIQLVFYGYLSDLNNVLVRQTFTGQGISTIVKTILDDIIVPKTEVTYDDADIEEAEAALTSISFNHTAKDAMSLLAELAGNFEWGVDSNKKFFFKKTDAVVRNVFVIGRDVANFKEQRKDEDVINVLNVFGSDGTEPLITRESDLSISKFGRKEDNRFETSISEISDANRLASVTLKNTTRSSRRIQFNIERDDIFLEQTKPLGAATLSKKDISKKNVYSKTLKKYGKNIKYGNLKRDQISSINYAIIGGGLKAQIQMIREVPNLGDQQKAIELQIKNIQRR